MSDHIYIVLLDIPARFEEKFNRIYDTDHLPLMMQVPGIRRCDRYRLQWSDNPEMLKHLAIYQIDDADVPRREDWKRQAGLGAWSAEMRPLVAARRNGAFTKLSTHRSNEPAAPQSAGDVGSPARHIYFLQQSVPAEHVDRFNHLYETDHLPLMMQTPGVHGCNRYALAWSESGDVPDYLAVYEIGSPEIPRSADWKRQTSLGAWPTEMRPKFTARRNGAFSLTSSFVGSS